MLVVKRRRKWGRLQDQRFNLPEPWMLYKGGRRLLRVVLSSVIPKTQSPILQAISVKGSHMLKCLNKDPKIWVIKERDHY